MRHRASLALAGCCVPATMVPTPIHRRHDITEQLLLIGAVRPSRPRQHRTIYAWSVEANEEAGMLEYIYEAA